jgi:hypothetical protein
MQKKVLHTFKDKTPKSSARWFQTLSISERMDMLRFFTDIISQKNLT